ncbi:MAG: thioredoxin domain-containing protein [Actinomycetia bacterium]|nr:thioredoxin domain-containing protein [Actinomycetes bacterium]
MNRLRSATSPYLQQHADNPVDWWEWSPQAFAAAEQRDVPVFLSVGYAACHWCHVMAHESFEDPTVAALLNENFVSIKVDREERPDVDALYMRATQALTGQGGWPMTVFLDPAGRPFYAGTYFPPEPRHGMPSFTELLLGISRVWSSERDRVSGTAESLTEAIARHATSTQPAPSPEAPLADVLRDAMDQGAVLLRNQFDPQHAGFGGAPKFPPGMALEFLLRYEAATGESWALDVVSQTCHRMARGGMYDQIGGGFARYSVDNQWVVPHFEKMLYDNALLLRLYAHLWRATGDPLAKRVTEETAEFLLVELTTPEGGFASALDADSDEVIAGVGREGAYYVWDEGTLSDALGPQDAQWVQQLCAVGNPHTFEAVSSVLQLRSDPDDWARWARVRATLAQVRSRRPAPARDDKVVAAWNGLAITALVEAGGILQKPAWIAAAQRCGQLLSDLHVQVDGAQTKVARVSRDGLVGDPPGVLEDYGAVANAFLSLYQATGEEAWFSRARHLLAAAMHRFYPDEGFTDVDASATPLVVAVTDVADNAYPSGTSSILEALVTAGTLAPDTDLLAVADAQLAKLAPAAGQQPRFAGLLLATMTARSTGPAEVKLSTKAEPPLRLVTNLSTRPGLVINPQTGPADSASAQVCQDNVCLLPTNDPAALAQELGARLSWGEPAADD